MRTLLPLAWLPLAACQSQLTGNLGNFQFSYPADGDRLRSARWAADEACTRAPAG